MSISNKSKRLRSNFDQQPYPKRQRRDAKVEIEQAKRKGGKILTTQRILECQGSFVSIDVNSQGKSHHVCLFNSIIDFWRKNNIEDKMDIDIISNHDSVINSSFDSVCYDYSVGSSNPSKRKWMELEFYSTSTVEEDPRCCIRKKQKLLHGPPSLLDIITHFVHSKPEGDLCSDFTDLSYEESHMGSLPRSYIVDLSVYECILRVPCISYYLVIPLAVEDWSEGSSPNLQGTFLGTMRCTGKVLIVLCSEFKVFDPGLISLCCWFLVATQLRKSLYFYIERVVAEYVETLGHIVTSSVGFLYAIFSCLVVLDFKMPMNYVIATNLEDDFDIEIKDFVKGIGSFDDLKFFRCHFGSVTLEYNVFLKKSDNSEAATLPFISFFAKNDNCIQWLIAWFLHSFISSNRSTNPDEIWTSPKMQLNKEGRLQLKSNEVFIQIELHLQNLHESNSIHTPQSCMFANSIDKFACALRVSKSCNNLLVVFFNLCRPNIDIFKNLGFCRDTDHEDYPLVCSCHKRLPNWFPFVLLYHSMFAKDLVYKDAQAKIIKELLHHTSTLRRTWVSRKASAIDDSKAFCFILFQLFYVIFYALFGKSPTVGFISFIMC